MKQAAVASKEEDSVEEDFSEDDFEDDEDDEEVKPVKVTVNRDVPDDDFEVNEVEDATQSQPSAPFQPIAAVTKK